MTNLTALIIITLLGRCVRSSTSPVVASLHESDFFLRRSSVPSVIKSGPSDTSALCKWLRRSRTGITTPAMWASWQSMHIFLLPLSPKKSLVSPFLCVRCAVICSKNGHSPVCFCICWMSMQRSSMVPPPASTPSDSDSRVWPSSPIAKTFTQFP